MVNETERRESNVDPICIFNLFSTLIQRWAVYFTTFVQRLSNAIMPAGLCNDLYLVLLFSV